MEKGKTEMKRDKVFISGKITGDPNYREKFEKAEVYLKKHGYIVMNPAILPEGFEWDEYMDITVAMLRACDTIAMLPGWRNSKGAKCEYIIAKAGEKKILEFNQDYQLKSCIKSTKQK